MDKQQFEVVRSALIRIEKRQTEMAEDITSVMSSVTELKGKTIVISDVDKRINALSEDIKNIKDEVIA